MNIPKEEAMLKQLKEKIDNLDNLAESRGLTSTELEGRKNGQQKVMELEKLDVLDLKQKSRIRWAVDGDETHD